MVDLDSILAQISHRDEAYAITTSKAIPGSHYDVYRLTKPDKSEYALQVIRSDDFTTLIASKARILAHLNAFLPKLRIPHDIRHTDQYALLSWIDGEALSEKQRYIWDQAERLKFIDDLANLMYQVWTCPAPEAVSPVSYKDWLRAEIDAAFIRGIEDPSWGDPIHFLHRRARLHKIVTSEDASSMVIRHDDLSPNKIMVDGHQLSGVIGWDRATWTPAPAAVVYPALIADMPGWVVSGHAGVDCSDERVQFAATVSKLAEEGGRPDIARLLSTAKERKFFELSLTNKRVNEKYIELVLKVDIEKFDWRAAQYHCEAFLNDNAWVMNDQRLMQAISAVRLNWDFWGSDW